MRRTFLMTMFFLQLCFVSVVCFALVVSSTTSLLCGEINALTALPSSKDKFNSRPCHNMLDKLSALHVSTSDFQEVVPNSVPHQTAVPLPANDIAKNFWLRMTFSWVHNLIRTGNKRPLQMYDLWTMEEKDQMLHSSAKFEEIFEQEKRKQLLFEKSSSQAMEDIAANPNMKLRRKKNKKKYLNIISEFWRSPVSRAILIMYKKEFVVSGVVKFVNTLVQFFPSILIAQLLKSLSSTDQTAWTIPMLQQVKNPKGVVLAVLLYLCLCAKTTVENQYFDMVTVLGAQIRGTLSAAIYQKSLKLSPTGRQFNTLGEILNFMQIDAGRLEYVAGSIHTVWDGLFQILGYTCLLLYFLGPSVFAGIAAMLVILPLNAHFLRRLSKVREVNLKFTDKRVRLTNEILQGIRAIKSYNWEKPFRDQLEKVREEELHWLRAAANSRAILVAALSAAPSFVAVFSLSLYALLGNEVSPTNVFTSLALFNQLRFPLTFFPMLLNSLAEGKVSLDRISKFLFADEVERYVEEQFTDEDGKNYQLKNDGRGHVLLQNASFTWTKSASNNTLQQDIGDGFRGRLDNVNLHIKKGELIAIVGPTGSGKSTLLQAILGELNKEEGRVVARGNIAYVSQTSWLPNDSLRNVVLFGEKMFWNRYREALRVSGLGRDLELLESGDLTEIGERGTNLSGGQKQRISIARAVYQNADIYLFDDPLSALDSEVGSKVFEDCIKTALAAKTRVLVTHNLNVLRDVDRIILMDTCETQANDQNNSTVGNAGCRIIDQGSFYELLSRGYDLRKFVEKAEEPTPNLSHSDEANEINSGITDSSEQQSEAMLAEAVMSDILQEDEEESPAHQHSAIGSSSPTDPKALMTVEERGEGSVGLHVYKAYLREAKKPLLLFAIVLSFFFSNCSQIMQQYVVSAWTSDFSYRKRSMAVYLSGIALMASSVAFFSWLRTYLAALVAAEASKVIHLKMVQTISSAPLSFYESTPIGRLLQRFSKDLDQIDQQLPSSMGQLVASSLQIFSSMLAICFVTPSFSIMMLLLMSIYLSIMNYYRPVARELKRLDSLSRSPVYSHFSETLGGLPIIRAFRRQKMFIVHNVGRLDDNLSAFFSLKAVDRWLSVRLELLGNSIVLASALLAVFTGSKAGSTGLSLNNALGITTLLNWAVRNAAETESLMNSVERVYYTISATPQEQPSEATEIPQQAFLHDAVPKQTFTEDEPQTNEHLPSSDQQLKQLGWPWQGHIVMKDVRMKYRGDFDPVLRNVTLDITAGERIGIVGRTGSGKSSLFRGILRLSELEEGGIFIDGVNISSIGLHTLRSSISVIPQDPTLFSGSIRMNLDPHQQHNDQDLWDALRKVNLARIVRALPNALQYEVSEGGENFSSGQRQLLCLCRALIRKSRIILLDEATSSVDYETDALIQKTIRDEFGDGETTVLTIAHRLGTIMDADKILVMEAGHVKEFDQPRNLLNNPESIFYKLVQAEQQQQLRRHKHIRNNPLPRSGSTAIGN